MDLPEVWTDIQWWQDVLGWQWWRWLVCVDELGVIKLWASPLRFFGAFLSSSSHTLSSSTGWGIWVFHQVAAKIFESRLVCLQQGTEHMTVNLM